jgi:hypothetical protein
MRGLGRRPSRGTAAGRGEVVSPLRVGTVLAPLGFGLAPPRRFIAAH